MKIRIVIDRAQALWTVQQAVLKEFPKLCRGRKPPASIIHTMWQSVVNSSAYGIQGMNVIYMQSKIPEELIPMILNHEELHLLYYELAKEMTDDNWKAAQAAKHIDNPKLNKWLCDLFNLDHKLFLSYLKDYIINNLPIIRSIIGLKKWLCSQWKTK